MEMVMKYRILFAALATTASLAVAPAAMAREGCGAGWHRGAYGRCVRNGGPLRIVVAPARPVIGVYYHRHGWWDGRRYWQQRYRHRNHWRYR
jgi:hypothetical protein